MLSLTPLFVPSLMLTGTVAAPLLQCRVNQSPAMVATGDLVRVVADVEIGEGVSAQDMVGTVLTDGEIITVELRKPILGYFEYGELKSLKGSSGELVEGDRVKVVESVTVKGGIDALGLEGTVFSVWEQCETDPACCCNELATVPLQINLDPPASSDGDASSAAGNAAAASSSWTCQLSAEAVVVLRPAGE